MFTSHVLVAKQNSRQLKEFCLLSLKKKPTGDFVQCFFSLGLHRCSSNLCLFIIVTCISGLDGKHSPKGDVELVKYGWYFSQWELLEWWYGIREGETPFSVLSRRWPWSKRQEHALQWFIFRKEGTQCAQVWTFRGFLLLLHHVYLTHLCPASSKLSFFWTSILLSGSSVKRVRR